MTRWQRIEDSLRLLDDEDNDDGGRWDWDAPPPPAAIRGHHHHHRHGLDDVLNMMGGQPFGGKRTSTKV